MYLADLANIYEQLARDRLSAPNKDNFAYYTRTAKVARNQGIPDVPELQISLIGSLAPQSGFKVISTGDLGGTRRKVNIQILDEDKFMGEYNKFASSKARQIEASKPHNKIMADLRFQAELEDQLEPLKELKLLNKPPRVTYHTRKHAVPEGSKIYCLLVFLKSNKNYLFKVNDIQEKVNTGIANQKDKIKSHKDVADAIRNLKKNLGVQLDEYFPIDTSSKRIIWRE